MTASEREQNVLERIEKARRRKAVLREDRITMAHGAGGKATHTLINAVFLEAFRNPLLEPLEDQAVFSVNGTRVAMTTDSFVVSPLFFPGGDIGDLAITIMLARGELDLVAELRSDTAPLWDLVDRVLDATSEIRCMRDDTRGGVATILNEIAAIAAVSVVVDEDAVPVRAEVRGACEILG